MTQSPTVLFPPRGGEEVGLIHILSIQANSEKKYYSPCFSIKSLQYPLASVMRFLLAPVMSQSISLFSDTSADLRT